MMARPRGAMAVALGALVLLGIAQAAPATMPEFVLSDIAHGNTPVDAASLRGKPCLVVLNTGT